MLKKLWMAVITVVDTSLFLYSGYECWKVQGNIWVLWLVATLFFFREVGKDLGVE
jgi:hypothetical protein